MDRDPADLSDADFGLVIVEYRRLRGEIDRLEAEGKRAPRAIKGIPATDIASLSDLEL